MPNYGNNINAVVGFESPPLRCFAIESKEPNIHAQDLFPLYFSSATVYPACHELATPCLKRYR